ncbi:hypothetical protein SGFS_072260 [Streptomyces graminofaciens]|jgi:hypothetical protein|uniref:Secreted protein n=1 Tax=Streptomyces graminofaciens TaxID=68212 RepID=A0ABN5VRY1_9ACTN|nr:hypothetical protein [Streptomyces graminofaciens]BBC35932.1 hypothetical protein SGFS_072260 [Streptomyces graminofaciens]
MIKSLTVAGAAGVALLVGSTGAIAASAPAPAKTTSVVSAQKEATPAAAAATCNVALGKPWKENIAKVGRSDHARAKYHTVNSCSGFSLSATLQYKRWDGWRALDKDTWAGNRKKDRILQWKCQGKGTFTYRVAGTVKGGWTGDEPRVGRGNGPERRFSC